MNYSRQREIILDTLKSNVVHPTAEYIYSILQKENPKISLATLYRNLNQLAEHGIIKKIDGLEQSSHYDHNTHAHYHFICDNCKKVYDISSAIAPELVERAETETDFQILGHDIVFHGICKECKNRQEG
ncbi:MAG: transcriptional repressor [Brachyspira sp.]|jgi:ferric uptake regulator, fur family|nr:transcriptional repressor [Brachyspira sp.]